MKKAQSIEAQNIYKLEPGNFLWYSPVPLVTSECKIAPDETKVYQIEETLSTDDSSGFSYLAKRKDGKCEDRVFIKTPKLNQRMTLDVCDRVLQSAKESFQAEWDNRTRIQELNREQKVAVEIEAFGQFRVADTKRKIDRYVPYLVQEYISEDSLEKYFVKNKMFCDTAGRFSGITEPALWFELASKITEILRRIHNRQIVHGEYVPKNILLKKDENGQLWPIIVDFGNSFLLDISPGLLDTVATSNPYISPESREGKGPWYTPADIYALGGVLYYLATGESPPDIKTMPFFEQAGSWAYPTNEQVNEWKKIIHNRFALNKGLMDRNEGIVKIIDKCLRPNPLDRYSSADKVIHGLDAVTFMERSEFNIDSNLTQLSTLWGKLKSSGAQITKKPYSVFASILSDRLHMLSKEMQDMSNGHFEIFGEREDIIDLLVKYIGVLKRGDCYMTVTVPDYWTEENLGVNGRFLTVNKDLARNSVIVNRLFLICPDDLTEDSEARRILIAHRDAWNSLAQQHKSTSFVDPDSDRDINCGSMFVGALLLTSRQEVQEMQKRLNHVAIWRSGTQGRMMSIVFNSIPIYRKKDGSRVVHDGSRIVKVRFRELQETQEHEDLVAQFRNINIRSLCEIDELCGSTS